MYLHVNPQRTVSTRTDLTRCGGNLSGRGGRGEGGRGGRIRSPLTAHRGGKAEWSGKEDREEGHAGRANVGGGAPPRLLLPPSRMSATRGERAREALAPRCPQATSAAHSATLY